MAGCTALVRVWCMVVAALLSPCVASNTPSAYSRPLQVLRARMPHVPVALERSVKVTGGRVLSQRYTAFLNTTSSADVAAVFTALDVPRVGAWAANASANGAAFVYVGATGQRRFSDDGVTYRAYVEMAAGVEASVRHPLVPARTVTARVVAVKWRPQQVDPVSDALVDVYTSGPTAVQGVEAEVEALLTPSMLSPSARGDVVRCFMHLVHKLEWAKQPTVYSLVKSRGGDPVQLSVGFPSVAAPIVHVAADVDKVARAMGADGGAFLAPVTAAMDRVTHFQIGTEAGGRPMFTMYYRPYSPE